MNRYMYVFKMGKAKKKLLRANVVLQRRNTISRTIWCSNQWKENCVQFQRKRVCCVWLEVTNKWIIDVWNQISNSSRYRLVLFLSRTHTSPHLLLSCLTFFCKIFPKRKWSGSLASWRRLNWTKLLCLLSVEMVYKSFIYTKCLTSWKFELNGCYYIERVETIGQLKPKPVIIDNS